MSITLRPEHGYLLASVVGSYVLHHGYMNVKVMMARKKYKVDYPTLYASAEECKNEEHRTKFNCVQRAHQNALENQPIFLALLLCSGLRFPVTSAIAAALYLAGRVLYMEGYSTGKPNSRAWGFFLMYPSLFCMIGCAIRTSIALIKGQV